MKKRIAALVLCLALVFALAACGGRPRDRVQPRRRAPRPSPRRTCPTWRSPPTSTSAPAAPPAPTTASAAPSAPTSPTTPSDHHRRHHRRLSGQHRDGRRGRVDLGFVQSDVMSYAYSGTNLFTEPVTGFTTLHGPLHGAGADRHPRPRDKDRRRPGRQEPSPSAPSAPACTSTPSTCSAPMTSPRDDISPRLPELRRQRRALQDGRIDAAFIVAGAPTTSIVQLATAQEVHLVSLDQEHIDKLIEVQPLLQRLHHRRRRLRHR